MSQEPAGSASPSRSTRVVVATTVMLSFISFWRAAAIVLADLGSSAFYAGGIAEEAIGQAAPWLILGVMLFSYAVRAVYVESCAMFTRGGVYRVVKASMGGTLAKLSVSALMFDYILTGPISGVSAGQYIIGLVAQVLTSMGHPWHPDKTTVNHLAAVIALLVTVYFWWRNTKGIHESSDDALKIMYITTVMVVLLIGWGLITILVSPDKQRLPPLPGIGSLSFSPDALGWLRTLLPSYFVVQPAAHAATEAAKESSRLGFIPGAGSLLGLIGILVAFGHSILAMSGEETLAQVNRELEHPKHKNLMRAGMVIFIYSLLFTSLVSFFAYAMIPDHDRTTKYIDNLIAGISMNLVGPEILKLLFQGFIVMVGSLLLSSAVNTAIIGSNSVLNRISEDGVLTDWFRRPHKKYGTSYRTINMIVILQLVTILGSRGDVYVLGEAYAFGVVWSFAFNSLAMLVLRFKDPSIREWKVPLNLKIKGREYPVGLAVIAMTLFTLAGINMITKQVATISGLLITAVFSTTFFISERINERRRKDAHVPMDQFNLQPQDDVSNQTVEVPPGNTLCLVRDYTSLDHVRWALEKADPDRHSLVVMTIHLLKGPNAGYKGLNENRVFTSYEQLLFSRVVALAEKAGKPVDLLVVPASNVYQAIVQTAAQLYSAEIILGHSAVITPAQQSLRLGEAWEKLSPQPKHQVRLRVFNPEGTTDEFLLGAHAPELTEQEVNQVHRLWLDVKRELGGEVIHHKDIISIALRRMEEEMSSDEREIILKEIREHSLYSSPSPKNDVRAGKN
jgi:amino acid transporter